MCHTVYTTAEVLVEHSLVRVDGIWGAFETFGLQMLYFTGGFGRS